MKDALQKILFFLQLAPVIIGTVKAIEISMPEPKQGSKKLDMVLGIVGTAVDAAPEIVNSIDKKDINTAVTGIVNVTVATMNAINAAKAAQ